MKCSQEMLSSVFHFPAGITIDSIDPSANELVIGIACETPTEPTRAVRVLGLDDFAWKKRFTYGTILVDLERRTIIDVLADRESATVAAWLQAHPEVEVVSRDRGKDFAKAASLGAPQAQQVVALFHLVRNLAEVLQKSWHTVGRRSGRQTRISNCHPRQERGLLVHFPLSPPGNNAHHPISKWPIKPVKPAATIGFVR